MNKKLWPSLLGLFCGALSSILYYIIANHIFNSTMPVGVPYASMFNVAFWTFAVSAVFYFAIFYFLKEKYKKFSFVFIYSAMIVSILLLYVMSTIKYYF